MSHHEAFEATYCYSDSDEESEDVISQIGKKRRIPEGGYGGIDWAAKRHMG